MVFCKILLKEQVYLYKNNQKAFTLIEVMAVISMLSVFSLLIYPQFNSFLNKTSLDQAAFQLASDINYVKQNSIANDGNGLGKIVIYKANNSYYVFVNPMKSEKKVDFKEIYNSRVQITGYSGPLNEISFNYLGVPTRCGTVTVKNKDGAFKYVIVSPVVGRVRVDDRPPTSWN